MNSLTEKGENAPLLPPPNTDVTPDGPPLDYTSVPPPSNPGYNITPTTDSTGYNTGVPHNTGVPPNYTGVGYQQYSLTYHPQYAGIKEKHMIMTQPIAVTDTEVERPLYTPSDYTSKFIILLIWSAVAFFVCWPISLVVCCLTCAAILKSSRNQNPNPLMIAAVILVVICLAVGIPLQVFYWAWYRRDHPNNHL
ncbi:uncharacterized protein [Dysidea avara]|uniref:uncharacterized protein n=1 Tax=Dysidea avara TaxID=196820 RepID=UPI0033340F71